MIIIIWIESLYIRKFIEIMVFRTVKKIRRSHTSRYIKKKTHDIYTIESQSTLTGKLQHHGIVVRESAIVAIWSGRKGIDNKTWFVSCFSYYIFTFVEMFTLCSPENQQIHSRSCGRKFPKKKPKTFYCLFSHCHNNTCNFFLVFFSQFQPSITEWAIVVRIIHFVYITTWTF